MKNIFLVLLVGLLTGCILALSAGTHGSIKGYQYSVPKFELEEAVNDVIEKNSSLYRPVLKNKPYSGDYYNKGGYVTLKVFKPDTFEFIFRYYGDSVHWKGSAASEIFICYAHDKNGKGGSEGHHSFRFKQGLKKKLTTIFETEFVNKIDKELGLKHIDSD